MENQTQVTVVDSIMGSGKTTWIIDHLQETKSRYIIIAPTLDIVDETYNRLRNAKKLNNLTEEQVLGRSNKSSKTDKGRKKDKLREFISKGKNAIVTHKLIQMIDEETKRNIQQMGYELYMDEALDFYSVKELRKGDVNILLKSGAMTVREDGLIECLERQDSRYNDIQYLVNNSCAYLVGEQIILGLIPPELFQIFSHVYVMTYQFEYSMLRCYFELYDIKYEIKSIGMGKEGKRELVDYVKKGGGDYKSLIELPGKGINDIGNKENDLSVSWYKRESKNKSKKREVILPKSSRKKKDDKKDGLSTLSTNVTSFLTYCKSIKMYDKRIEMWKPVLWTTFSDYKDKLAIRGLSDENSFMAYNCKGINKYRDYAYVVYLINNYVHPGILTFWADKEIEFDRDNFALASMLQFIFRTRIRNGEDYGDRSIKVYIPSKRMRSLLLDWLDEKR